MEGSVSAEFKSRVGEGQVEVLRVDETARTLVVGVVSSSQGIRIERRVGRLKRLGTWSGGGEAENGQD